MSNIKNRKNKILSARRCEPEDCVHERIACRRSILVILFENLIKFLPLTLITLIIFISNDSDLLQSYKLFVYRFICFIFIAEIFRNFYDAVYLIGNRRLIQMTGILSLNYKRSSINISHIREVRLKQSIWGRIFKHGTLQMGTSSTKDYEIIFKDIFLARKVRKLIENKIHFEREIAESDLAAFDNKHVTLALD
jgi:uncharacterized membrane protein YdbT with pleckstrin-like domain